MLLFDQRKAWRDNVQEEIQKKNWLPSSWKSFQDQSLPDIDLVVAAKVVVAGVGDEIAVHHQH